MATVTIATSDYGAYNKSLAAATVDTINFQYDRVHNVVVQCHTGGPIYVTHNDIAPTVEGPQCIAVVSTGIAATIHSDDNLENVKLISSTTSTYSVIIAR